MDEVRITIAVATVLRTFLDDTTRPRYGYELMRLTGYPSGKLYPILARLQRAGWLSRDQEPIDPAVAGRPARRWYRLTPQGVHAARHELAALSQQLRPSHQAIRQAATPGRTGMKTLALPSAPDESSTPGNAVSGRRPWMVSPP
jgi:PadR family transcriptional regulator PadR